MAWTRNAAPKPPENVLAGTVGLCGWIGWLPGAWLAAWLLIHAQRLTEGHFVGAYVIIFATTTAASMLFMHVREGQDAMRVLSLAPREVARGAILGAVVSGGCVAVAWGLMGFKGLYTLAPFVGAPLGAWLAARRVEPFGEARSDTTSGAAWRK